MKKVIASTLAIALSCMFSLSADAAKKNKRLLPGHVAKQNISKVNQGINWHTSMRQAQNLANREGKMILWVQMIGKMDGAT